jgi:hypothetical protein
VSRLSVAPVALSADPAGRALPHVAAREQDWPASEGCGGVKVEVDLAVALLDDASPGFLVAEDSLQCDRLLCVADQHKEAGPLCVGRGKAISDGGRPVGLHVGRPPAPPADAEPAGVIAGLHDEDDADGRSSGGGRVLEAWGGDRIWAAVAVLNLSPGVLLVGGSVLLASQTPV